MKGFVMVHTFYLLPDTNLSISVAGPAILPFRMDVVAKLAARVCDVSFVRCLSLSISYAEFAHTT